MKTLRLLIILTLSLFWTIAARAQGSAFIYQGQLRDGGTNANGNYTMTFKLYDALSGGNAVGTNTIAGATLVNGIFSVTLDFGSGAFNGSSRWLETTVDNGSTVETISPRTPLLPTPYAQYAAKANSLDSGTWTFHTGNFEEFSNVFEIFDDGILVMGMSTNGVLFNGGIDTSKAHVGNLDIDGNVNVNNGESIFFSNTNGNSGVNVSSDGDIGLAIGGPVTIGNRLTFNDGSFLSVGGQGSLLTSGDLTTSNVMFYGNTLRFPSQGGATLVVQTNGDFVFDGNLRVSAQGILKIPTENPTPVSLSAYGQGGQTLVVDARIQQCHQPAHAGERFCSDRC
ncbi:MAG TPA: hypothetical protein VN625_00555 [Desulfuromonadaceae bacterium]|nr:hypothetical protein [Desulfuromonadaceae bacterium]